MGRHPYKYLAKVVHRVFFPIFALLENDAAKAGLKVVAQRKLLYLEKMYAAILLGAPRVRKQLATRLDELRKEVTQLLQQELCLPNVDVLRRRQALLAILEGMQTLLNFFLPAVFRVVYLVRCCT